MAEDGLHVHFNRDERKDREAVAPPHLWNGDPHPFIAPVDFHGGGTWLAVSADGTVRAVLSEDDRKPKPAADEINSELVLYRLASGIWELTSLLENPRPLNGIAPFHLMIITVKGATRYIWDGDLWQRKSEEFPAGCFTTSSCSSEEIAAFRRAAFARIFAKGRPLDPSGLERYHDGLETVSNPSASVVMDRPNTRTVSQTRIHIHSGRVAVSYRPRDPVGEGFCQHWTETRLSERIRP